MLRLGRWIWIAVLAAWLPVMAAAQSLTFTQGFVGGYIGTTTNVLSAPVRFDAAGIASVTFSQNTPSGLYENTQGNDVGGTITLTSTTGATRSFTGAANWRYTQQGALIGIGIVPATGADTTFNFNGTVLSPTNLMVINLNSNYGAVTIGADRFGTPEINGNAAPVAADLNDILLANIAPQMTVTKTVTSLDEDPATQGVQVEDRLAEAGDIVRFTITVRNSGNVDLVDFALTDDAVDADGDPLSGTLSAPSPSLTDATLPVGDTVTYTFDYTITGQEGRRLENIATATGTPAFVPVNATALPFSVESSSAGNTGGSLTGATIDGAPTVFSDFLTTLESPTMELVKTGAYVDADGDGTVDAGDIIRWTFSLTNTSAEASLYNVTVADDALDGRDGVDLTTLAADGPIGAGQTVTLGTIDMELDATEAAAGRVENIAAATACSADEDPCGTEGGLSVTDESSDASGALAAPTVVTFGPAIRVTKTADVQDLGTAAAGDPVTFTVTVQNVGNLPVTLLGVFDPEATDQIAAGESFEQVSGSEDANFPPEQTRVWRATLILTEADIAAKSVGNIAFAEFRLPGAPDNTSAIVRSSANGNTVPGPQAGAETVLTLSLIDQIDEQLIDILENDLRLTMQTQSRRFARMAADALDTLKEGRDEQQACGDQGGPGFKGTLSVTDGKLTANGDLNRQTYDCVLEERRILSGEVSVSRLDVLGAQITGSFSVQRERFVGDDKVRGTFWGGYANSTSLEGSVSGSIRGLGLNAGLYGATRIGDDVFMDHYLAGAAGLHRFDLTFNPVAPIDAKGDYSYVAAFGGVGLSTETTWNTTVIAPRIAIDLAYALTGDVNVAARQFAGTPDARNERGKLRLSNFEGARVLAEIQLSDADNPSLGEAADSLSYQFTPRVFCDYGFQRTSETDCGTGLSFEAERHADENLSYGVLADFETSGTYRRMTMSLSRTLRFDQGNGTVVSSMGVDEEGRGIFAHTLNWRF